MQIPFHPRKGLNRKVVFIINLPTMKRTIIAETKLPLQLIK
jgi:hypothetical protein